MSRQPKPITIRNGYYQAQWLENGKQYRLALGTKDLMEAHRRFPIVRHTKMAWDTYCRTTSQFVQNPVHKIVSIGQQEFETPETLNGTKDGITNLLEQAILAGLAKFDESSGNWSFDIPANNNPNNLVSTVKTLEPILQSTNDIEKIKDFYLNAVQQIFKDKETSLRFAKIWITFLESNGIRSWNQIDEKLLIEFKEWRYKTPFPGNNQKNPKPPSPIVVNRHIQYLSRSFDLAVNKEYLKNNPVQFWTKDSHQGKIKQGLSVDELQAVLTDEKWQQDYLMDGKYRIELGYSLQDYLLLLFLSCKRRAEIINLQIENISFENHYVTYFETKNNSKSGYPTQKAFWISPRIEILLKKVIGERTEGLLFPVYRKSNTKGKRTKNCILNGDYISELFKEMVSKYAPKKDVTLHCLRQTATDIMEHAGLNDNEIDNVLGHYSVKTALPHYQDRSEIAIAKRLSRLNRKGIEVLSKTVESMGI